MAKTFAVSGQHYLFTVQAFAHAILTQGGAEYDYSLRDRTTRQVIEDVASGASELGIILETSASEEGLEAAFAEKGLEFHSLVASSPMIALGASHPLSSSKTLCIEQLEDWPYIRFEQEDEDVVFAEEALCDVPRKKIVSCTDRASLSELITAINGYTVTSGILVGITDGGSLTTIPLETDVRLNLGYLAPKGAALSDIAKRFIGYLEKSLRMYAR